MLQLFGKKKLNTERVAHHLVNAILNSVEEGFDSIAEYIAYCPEFVTTPPIRKDDSGKFLMIVIAGNFNLLPKYFTSGQDEEIIYEASQKLAPVFDLSVSEFTNILNAYKEMMSRINTPSKNTLYAMSKAVFFKYNLNDYQQDYFKIMQTPNPLFLKRMDEIMANFLFDWESFTDKFKVVSQAAA
jgi:hypothetical protein